MTSVTLSRIALLLFTISAVSYAVFEYRHSYAGLQESIATIGSVSGLLAVAISGALAIKSSKWSVSVGWLFVTTCSLAVVILFARNFVGINY
jgi:hypothetical protein